MPFFCILKAHTRLEFQDAIKQLRIYNSMNMNRIWSEDGIMCTLPLLSEIVGYSTEHLFTLETNGGWYTLISDGCGKAARHLTHPQKSAQMLGKEQQPLYLDFCKWKKIVKRNRTEKISLKLKKAEGQWKNVIQFCVLFCYLNMLKSSVTFIQHFPSCTNLMRYFNSFQTGPLSL